MIVDVTSFEYPSGKRLIFTLDDSSGVTIDAMIKLPGTQQLENGKAHSSASIQEESPYVLFSKVDFNILENNIGKTVKIKGLLEVYRERMQIALRRYEIMRDSNAEVTFWEKAAHFKSHELGKAWELSEEQVRLCREEGEKHERREERRRKVLRKKQINPIPDNASKRKPLVKKADPMTGIQNTKANGSLQNDEQWKCPSGTCGRVNPLLATKCSLCGLARRAKINNKTTRKPDDSARVVWAGEEILLDPSTELIRIQKQSAPQISVGEQTVSVVKNQAKILSQSGLKAWCCLSISCGQNNNPDKASCSRCGIGRKPFSNKPLKSIADPAVQVWVGEETRPHAKADDWSCLSCGNNNHSNQTECTRCHSTRVSFKVDTKSTANNRQFADKQTGAEKVEKKLQFKAGDWTCPGCGNHVFGSKSTCTRCSTTRSISTPREQPGRHSEERSNPTQTTRETKIQAKPGDWSCPSCRNHVFGSKSKCPMCSTTRPGTQISKQRPESRTGTEAKFQVKTGDWTCGCGANNWARNTACFRCHAGHMMGKKEARFQVRPGDWTCGGCGKNNYSNLVACYKCGHEREEGQ